MKIGDFPHHLRAETAKQLRGEHVDADASGVRAARHHVMKNGSDGSVIPRHEKAGNKQSDEHG